MVKEERTNLPLEGSDKGTVSLEKFDRQNIYVPKL